MDRPKAKQNKTTRKNGQAYKTATPPTPSPSLPAGFSYKGLLPLGQSEKCIMSLRKQTIFLEKAPNMGVGMQKRSRAEFRENSQLQLQTYELSQLWQSNTVWALVWWQLVPSVPKWRLPANTLPFEGEACCGKKPMQPCKKLPQLLILLLISLHSYIEPATKNIRHLKKTNSIKKWKRLTNVTCLKKSNRWFREQKGSFKNLLICIFRNIYWLHKIKIAC